MSFKSYRMYKWIGRNLSTCRALMPDLKGLDKEVIHSWIKAKSTPQREGITPQIILGIYVGK